MSKLYKVRIFNNDSQHWSQWKEFKTMDAKMAAEITVEEKEWQDVEFPVGSGSEEIKVQVKDENGLVNNFIVSGESCPVYHAVKIK